MGRKRLLGYITGSVNEDLLLRNEFLAEENRILRSKLGPRMRLTDPERIRLATIGRKLGLKALEGLSAIVKPATILAWHRKLVAAKFDGSKKRGQGRPRVDAEIEGHVLRVARENRSWGYDRIVGSLANVCLKRSDLSAKSEDLAGFDLRFFAKRTSALARIRAAARVARPQARRTFFLRTDLHLRRPPDGRRDGRSRIALSESPAVEAAERRQEGPGRRRG